MKESWEKWQLSEWRSAVKEFAISLDRSKNYEFDELFKQQTDSKDEKPSLGKREKYMFE